MSRSTHFEERLTLTKSFNVNTIEMMLKMIALACRSDNSKSLNIWLKSLLESTFFKETLLDFLSNKRETIKVLELKNIILIFDTMVHHWPSFSMPIVTLLIPQMSMIINQAEKSTFEILKQDMHGLEEKLSDVRKQLHCGGLVRDIDRTKVEDFAGDYGKDFREMSVIPTTKDIKHAEDPFLRKNIIYEEYKNVNHYLDVQFRLIREDLIRPLRLGITELLQTQNQQVFRKLKSDIKLYENVQILRPSFSSEGLIYEIKFDVKHLKKIRWEASKRLKFGSLVCLSTDHFKTVIMATLANRDPDDLRRGKTYLQFECETMVTNDLLGKRIYEMVESPAYFEAYKYVLEGLQFLDENSLPFSNYLLNKSIDKVNSPKYLQNHNLVYDFSAVLDGKKSFKAPVLELDKWPTAEEMHLNESQYKALQTALTKDYVVIQGPPGTGKTFIGAKAVQLLLANRKAWCNAEHSGPILIVCYTNHALDQFLESILISCKHLKDGDVVRLGSRSTTENEKLMRCQINEIRKHRRFEYNELRGDLQTEVNKKQSLIMRSAAIIELVKKNIIHENALEAYMEKKHFNQMSKRQSQNMPPILNWLMEHKANNEPIIQECI